MSLSLKTRLTALVLTAVVVVWAVATWLTYRQARHEIDELLDAHLAQSVALLVAQTGEDLDEIETDHADLDLPFSSQVAFQIWEHGRRLVLHSADAPSAPMGEATPGFSDRVLDGHAWRVYTAWDHERENLVHVGERLDARQEIAGELLVAALTPLLLAVPLLGGLVWTAVRQGMRPLERVADDVGRREPDRLDPLERDGAPAELLPLLDRINALFVRVTRSIEHERRFTADAAHELRTPLAAVRAQAQVALGTTDDVERRAVLRKVLAGCDRTARLMEQLLTLARVDVAAAAPRVPVDLRALAMEAIAAAAPAAVARGIDVALDEGPGLAVPGHPELLQVLLRNLLDNAVRYTPDGGAVQVRVSREPAGRVRLAVTDSGDGIPESERSRVLERFYRLPGSRADGSGLGLSIVSRIAALHGATLSVGEGPGARGTSVAVLFPPLAAAVSPGA